MLWDMIAMTLAAPLPRIADAVALQSGLPAGTVVLTAEGELPVEHLMAGDRVITRTSGMAVLRAVEVSEGAVAMVRIMAGSLGHTRPDRDMRLGPDTPVHIRDWRAQALFGTPTAMIPAARLVDGEFVAVEAAAPVRLYRLVFDRAQVVYADGLEVGV